MAIFAKRVFFLAGGALTVYQWRQGRLVEPVVFRADEDGLTRFSLHLDKDPNTTAFVLVDFVEEEFRDDTIPHVFGRDREALLAVKTKRLFRDATYSHAIVQGREDEGRRDDKVLFSALIRPDLLKPWMAPMTRRRVRVAGIYSLPIFSQALLRKLSTSSNQALLVTVQSGGGLRQTFFRDHKLRISRLAVMQQVEKRAQASYILGEVEKLRRYLSSLRLITRDNPLDVYILHHGDVLSDLQQQAVDDVSTRHHLLSVTDVSREIGLKDELATSFSDQIFSHLLIGESPKNHYANSEETRYFQLNRARLGMYAASAVSFLIASIWSSVQVVEGFMAKEESARIAQQASIFERQYQSAKERFPPAPADGTNIRVAVEAIGKLKEYKTTPMNMMVTLSQVLEEFPDLRVEGIKWIASTDPARSVEGEQRTGASHRSGWTESTGGMENASDNLFQIARIEGRVERFAGDYRAAIQQVNGFADALAGTKGVENVRVLQLPLNISSERSLIGTAGVEVVTGTAEFELRVVLRVKSA